MDVRPPFKMANRFVYLDQKTCKLKITDGRLWGQGYSSGAQMSGILKLCTVLMSSTDNLTLNKFHV